MHSIIYLAILFIAKVIDNAINTTKTIMIQRSRWVLAGIAVILSDFIYFWIMRNVVTSDHMLTMLIVAIAGGVGCSLAWYINNMLWQRLLLFKGGILDDTTWKKRSQESTFKRGREPMQRW